MLITGSVTVKEADIPAEKQAQGTMEWLPLPLSAESHQTAPSPTIPGQNKGVRQGGVTQGPDPGCAFPFATRDLPGRYDGVGEGRSVATN